MPDYAAPLWLPVNAYATPESGGATNPGTSLPGPVADPTGPPAYAARPDDSIHRADRALPAGYAPPPPAPQWAAAEAVYGGTPTVEPIVP